MASAIDSSFVFRGVTVVDCRDATGIMVGKLDGKGAEMNARRLVAGGAGETPNATKISMQTETRSQCPGGRYANSPTFQFQGWVRSTEYPTSPERDGRLHNKGISIRTDVAILHSVVSLGLNATVNSWYPTFKFKGWAIVNHPFGIKAKS